MMLCCRARVCWLWSARSPCLHSGIRHAVGGLVAFSLSQQLGMHDDEWHSTPERNSAGGGGRAVTEMSDCHCWAQSSIGAMSETGLK
jgi:hypothetical protein